jgi:hypothetical protein
VLERPLPKLPEPRLTRLGCDRPDCRKLLEPNPEPVERLPDVEGRRTVLGRLVVVGVLKRPVVRKVWRFRTEAGGDL